MEPIPPNITFSPAIPLPSPFVPATRIKELRQYLSDEKHHSIQLAGQQVNFAAGQQANIAAAIKAYEEGVIDGSARTYFVNGKIVSKGEAYKGYGHVWIE
ncbi:hypothetical protein VF21_02081 [Pseudogymnoascus sp. 05NY08]|nr:hypothetical protein VF21_02081 [Pseudogymnoascus sp. 05NY08]